MNLYFRLLLLRLRAPRRRRLSPWETARTPFRVLPSDLDVLMHMNNGKYLSILDLGRVDLLIRSGVWKALRARRWYAVVAGQTITYRRSLELGQRFDLYTRMLGFDDRWGYVEQTFCVGETVYAQAFVRVRFLKGAGGAVEQEELEELIGGFPSDLVVSERLRDWTTASKAPASFDVATVVDD